MNSKSDQQAIRPHPAPADPPSPWPKILERLPEYEPDTLLLSLEFYRESVLRRLIGDDGHQSLTLVDIAEVARALSGGVSLSSGILPGDETGPNSLFWARSNGSTRLGIWVGPRTWRLLLRSPEPGGKDRRLRLPFPGLLFVCRQDASGAYIFAAPRRPKGLDAPLFHCPTPNVFPNGRICPGVTPSRAIRSSCPPSSSSPGSGTRVTPAAASRGNTPTTSAGSGTS